VIWSGHPLSTSSRAEYTFIESRMMFSLAKDAELRRTASSERQRIIQKILTPDPEDEKKKDETNESNALADTKTDPAKPERARLTLMQRMTAGAANTDALEREYRWLIENGLDPEQSRCGDCGCSIHSLFNRN